MSAYFFLPIALLSNFLVLYLGLTALLVPWFILNPRPRFVMVLSLLSFSVFQVLVFLDLAIFRIFKFHINGMVLNLIFTEGAWDSVSLGAKTVVPFIGGAVFLAAAEMILGLKLSNASHSSHSGISSRLSALRVLLLSLVVIFADKAIYAASDMTNNTPLLRVSRLLPLYQPLTVKRFMERVFGFAPDAYDSSPGQSAGSGLRYPLARLERQPLASYPNVVWIVIDAWRYDMLSREASPQIWRFSRRAQVFRNHLSGGNASRFGVFSLFYGVPGTYWRRFLVERRGPVLIDQMLDLGYDFSIISSTRLTYPEFRKTAFVRIPLAVEDHLRGSGAEERDPRGAARLMERLRRGRQGGRPFFAFLFLDAPHGPYAYPPRFARHAPALKAADYLRGPDAAAAVSLHNAYRNAVLFDDALVGRILRTLEGQGLLNDTVVLITGDHGEEFLEGGYLGHTSAFTREQTQVPLVLHVPGVAPAEHAYLTSHLDAAPTVLSLLGCTTPPSAYSSGRPLLDAGGRDFVLVAGWDSSALVDERTALVFSTESYNASLFEVRDRAAYRLLPPDRSPARRAELAAAFREITRFSD